ncbi:putative tRNA (cytidine(34)-2'-O)-methyltransferase [Drosera capensis]
MSSATAAAMEATGIRALTLIILPLPRLAVSLTSCQLRPLTFAGTWRTPRRALSQSIRAGHGSGNGSAVAGSVAAGDGDRRRVLQVVLVSPQVNNKQSIIPLNYENPINSGRQHKIPGNTGSIARTCAASAVGLHLVEPLGFPIDDTKLKRAGLDYWPYPSALCGVTYLSISYVVVKVHESWAEFREYFLNQDGQKRLLAFTKRGVSTHSDFRYKHGDWLVFGSETKGLPPEALRDCQDELYGGDTLRIPMVDTYVRCLNLSVSVGVAVYEASRQLNYEQLQFPPETQLPDGVSFLKEDVFA